MDSYLISVVYLALSLICMFLDFIRFVQVWKLFALMLQFRTFRVRLGILLFYLLHIHILIVDHTIVALSRNRTIIGSSLVTSGLSINAFGAKT